MGLGNQARPSSTLWWCEDGNSDDGTDGEVGMLMVMQMMVMTEMLTMVMMQ